MRRDDPTVADKVPARSTSYARLDLSAAVTMLDDITEAAEWSNVPWKRLLFWLLGAWLTLILLGLACGMAVHR
jgi:hypothetical protein